MNGVQRSLIDLLDAFCQDLLLHGATHPREGIECCVDSILYGLATVWANHETHLDGDGTVCALLVRMRLEIRAWLAAEPCSGDAGAHVVRLLLTKGNIAQRITASTLTERSPSWIEIAAGTRSVVDDSIRRARLPFDRVRSTLRQLRERAGVLGVHTMDRIFVVHGHDDEAKHSVARFIERLGKEAVILHEQPGCGGSIMEKLLRYSGVKFAIVLLTPDDEGRARADAVRRKNGLKPRARQNVVLEFGLFVGLLGRDKVCVITRGELELPSDMLGIVPIDYDEAGAWKTRLAQELRQAKLEVDAERVIAA